MLTCVCAASAKATSPQHGLLMPTEVKEKSAHRVELGEGAVGTPGGRDVAPQPRVPKKGNKHQLLSRRPAGREQPWRGHSSKEFAQWPRNVLPAGDEIGACPGRRKAGLFRASLHLATAAPSQRSARSPITEHT